MKRERERERERVRAMKTDVGKIGTCLKTAGC